jgi:hypothetical protein
MLLSPTSFFVSHSFLRKILCLTLLFFALFLPVLINERGAQATDPPAHLQQQAPPTAGAGNEQGTTALEAGNSIERELAGGQKHSYRITLAGGQFAGIIIEHRGIDVVARTGS